MSDPHECSACDGVSKIEEPNTLGLDTWHRCEVCLGASRISDRMPVSDALADAETLRRELGPSVQIGNRYLGLLDDPRQSGKVARVVARAAFRAVPGLRGDR